MEPQQFRELLLKPGTQLSLAGEYGGISPWNPSVLEGRLKTYIVIQRDRTLWQDKQDIWDTGVIMSMYSPLQMKDASGQDYIVHELLLLHRYPSVAWDNDDPSVFVYGIRQNENLGDSPLFTGDWEPKTVWLAGASTMAVDDPLAPSPISVLRKQRTQSKSTD